MKRRMKRDRIDILRDDLNLLINSDGDTVRFVWTEREGGYFNEVYGVYEGGREVEKELKIKGLGKVVDYKEDEMEYEYGRIRVGECIVRFPWDADLSPIIGKEGVKFYYKGQKWTIDSPLDIGDTYGDERYSIVVLGVKSVD